MTRGSAPDETRAKLLAAAADEIVQRGYSGASLSRTAERIGLTKGAFSRHFPTKGSIVDAIVAAAAERGPGILRVAQQTFPTSPIRTCILAIGGISAAAHADPVLSAALLLVQDPAIDIVRVAPFRQLVAGLLRVPLHAAVEQEGYVLTMSVDDAVQFLVVVLTGFLVASRFVEDFGARQEPLFLQAALAALGIVDAEEVVMDVLRQLAP